MKKQFTIFILIIIALLYVIFINSNKNNMEQQNKLKLTSTAFMNNQTIPMSYTCDGQNINPVLLINNVPNSTKSMALIVDDPDAPMGDWVHWLLWNIPIDTSIIKTDSIPSGSVQGLNDFKNNKYDGPCPPRGTHRYFFKIYALDLTLNLDRSSRKIDLENAMRGHILDQTELIGLYSK